MRLADLDDELIEDNIILFGVEHSDSSISYIKYHRTLYEDRIKKVVFNILRAYPTRTYIRDMFERRILRAANSADDYAKVVLKEGTVKYRFLFRKIWWLKVDNKPPIPL